MDFWLWLLLGLGSIAVYSLIQITLGFAGISKPPENSPAWFEEQGSKENKPRILFVGDSVTHGNVQPNWTKLVEQRLGDSYYYINGGMNGNTTADLLARMDELVAVKPDIVTLLIGNNNAMGSFERNLDRYKTSLQEAWNAETYESELRDIIEQLLKTKAKIIIFSLIPYGEFVDSEEFDRTRQYSRIINNLAEEYALTYLPIFETIEEKLREEGPVEGVPPVSEDLKMLMTGVVIRRQLLRQDWKRIAGIRKLRFTLDHIHISERTAEIMADMVANVIKDDKI